VRRVDDWTLTWIANAIAGEGFVELDEVSLPVYPFQDELVDRKLMLEKMSEETKRFLRYLYSTERLEEVVAPNGRISKKRVKELILWGICRGDRRKARAVERELREYVRICL